MKTFFALFFFILSLSAFSQSPIYQPLGSPVGNNIQREHPIHTFTLPAKNGVGLYGGVDSVGALIYNKLDSSVYKYDGNGVWTKIAGFDDFFDATTASTSPIVGLGGVILGTTDIKATLQALIYPSQSPTSSLSGGVTQELMATGAVLNYTLNYSAGRQASTVPLQSIIITSDNGQSYNKSFTQPSAPGTVSGTQAVTVPRNINIVFTNTVKTTDNKTATSTTSFSFLPKRYWGIVTSSSPTDAQIIATNSELSTVKAKSFSTQSNSPYYIEYAYPASEGDLTSIKVNTFESILAFTRTQRSFTNASGYSSLYNIYISNNQITVTNTQTVDAQ